MPCLAYDKVSDIAPLRGASQTARSGRKALVVRQELSQSLSLEALWVPKCTRCTVVDHGKDVGVKTYYSVQNGTVVGITSHLSAFTGRKPWFYPRRSANVSRISERVGLFQRVLHSIAERGLERSRYKSFKRLMKVGFQIPIKNLRKLVHHLTLQMEASKILAARARPRKRSWQKPSLTGETKSSVKTGIKVPLWNYTPSP